MASKPMTDERLAEIQETARQAGWMYAESANEAYGLYRPIEELLAEVDRLRVGDEAAEQLAWWREQMQTIDKDPSDTGHEEADSLLRDAVRALATLLGQQEAAEQLIAAYDAIGKYYA